MMEDGKQPESLGTEFFIAELARLDQEWAQRYNSLAKRMAAIEQKGKSPMDDPEKILGTLFLVVACIQVIPLIIDVFRRICPSSESLPSLPSSV